MEVGVRSVEGGLSSMEIGVSCIEGVVISVE